MFDVEVIERFDCLKDVYTFLRPASGSLTGMGRLLALLLEDIFKEFELSDIQKKVILREILMTFAFDGERSANPTQPISASTMDTSKITTNQDRV